MVNYTCVYCIVCLESRKRGKMQEKKNMKQIPKEERPMERCLRYGAQSLTDAELLAVFLHSGTKKKNVLGVARTVLEGANGRKGLQALFELCYEELIKIEGIGQVRAVQLLCVAEISKRLWRVEEKERLQFLTPKACAMHYMQQMRHLPREELRVAFLDTRQCLMSDMILSVGTVNASLVSVREVLIEALRHQAVHLILVHNHPSGNPMPSKEDIFVTRQVKSGCESVGLELNDHIIIGDNVYYSFRERGNFYNGSKE